MKKEWITIQEKETTARVLASEIEAFRTKDITKKGVRVYKEGQIGISGVIGDATDTQLEDDAIENLSAGIKYPYSLQTNHQEHRSYNDRPMDWEELKDLAESILKILREEYPDFSFSQVISATETSYKMENTEGLDLNYSDAFFLLSLLLKEKSTANLFDGALVCQSRNFDLDQFWNFNRGFLEAYRTKVQLPEGEKLPVFTMDYASLLGFLGRALNGERYAQGGSLFSKRLEQQLFTDKITVELNRNPLVKTSPFFDAEGMVLPNDHLKLIEAGKLKRLLTDKRTAQLYNLPHTGAATGAYDNPPTIDGDLGQLLAFKTDTQNIKDALKGQPAIFAYICSGGDFTADGGFATPVQVSFLFDGERLLGKLPEFSVRSHLTKMLGEDYIGTFQNDYFYFGDIPTQLQGYYMTITK